MSNGVAGFLLTLVTLGGCVRTDTISPNPPPVARNYWDNPGGNGSVWVTPLGDGCEWGAASDPDTIDLRADTAAINKSDGYGVTIYVGRATDATYTPLVTGALPQRDPGFTANVHIPDGAFISRPYPGSDNPLVLYDPVNQFGKALFFGGVTVGDGSSNVIHPGASITSRVSEWDDATSDHFGEDRETGNWGYNWGPGIITGYDLDPAHNPNYPHIQHMLRYSIGANHLKTNDINRSDTLKPDSWPDLKQDAQTGIDVYTGNLKAGTTIGIPKDVPMPSGLSEGGQALWWCLQHYGAIFRDQAGGGIHFNVDQTIENSAMVSGMIADLQTIKQSLRPLRNQHRAGQDFVRFPKNGPGRRIDSGPPPLADGNERGAS
jgi:hypothetical protein